MADLPHELIEILKRFSFRTPISLATPNLLILMTIKVEVGTTVMAQQLEKLLLVQSCMRKCLPSSRSSDLVAIDLPLLQQGQPPAEGVSSG